MINVKELRIGNYVEGVFSEAHEDYETEYFDGQCRVLAIDSIGMSDWTLQVDGSKDVEWYDGFNPLKLTEGWLLRFGFKRMGEYEPDYSRLRKGDMALFQWTKGEGWEINGMEDIGSINTVHKLQNVYYYLFGEELKLDNYE